MLSEIGYTVIVSQGGKQAIKQLTTDDEIVDLVILDLIMPDMDGNTTFDRITEIAPDTPVILSSGYSINDQATRIIENGCNGFIQKPFNLSELSLKIRSVLDAAEHPLDVVKRMA